MTTVGEHHGPPAPARPFPLGSGYFQRELDLSLSTYWHPDTMEWEARSNAWAAELLAGTGRNREVLEVCARDAPLWACLCYPATADTARMTDVARMSLAYFLIDDCIYTDFLSGGRIGELIREFAEAVADPDARPATFLGRFLATTWRDMTARMTPGLRARWIAATDEYMRGTATEVASRAEGRAFTAEEYQHVRDESMAAGIVHLLGEHSVGLDMTDDIEADPELFDRVWRAANDQLLYVNDLYSFRKEYCDGGDFQHSLVHTGVVADGLTLQESVDRLCGLVEESERRYAQLCREILKEYDGAAHERMRAYLTQVERGLAGSRDYALVASRYHGRGFATARGNRYVAPRTSGWLVLQPGRSVFLDGPQK
ncbi:terpene synthase family protein [Streptomyces sp. NPDC000410]|uniref:terpene synthase family protein n=1 Tax=Streptomyces sp. NPDC000410 TaxID=3154254 RepID=UPI00331D9A6D